MKVYVLTYSYYEEFYIRGIYTEDAMKQEKKEFAEYRRIANLALIFNHNTEIERQRAKRKLIIDKEQELLEQQRKAKADGDAVREKELKKERKVLIKSIELNSNRIKTLQAYIEMLNNMTEEDLVKDYMNREHLYFEEFDVLGTED